MDKVKGDLFINNLKNRKKGFCLWGFNFSVYSSWTKYHPPFYSDDISAKQAANIEATFNYAIAYNETMRQVLKKYFKGEYVVHEASNEELFTQEVMTNGLP